MTVIESGRQVRKALRSAFPKTNISVKTDRHNGIDIEWDDTITDVDGMVTALLSSGVAQLGKPGWDGNQWPEIDGDRIHLSCFNREKREAAERDYERSRAEEAARQAREHKALIAAQLAKRQCLATTVQHEQHEQPDPAVHQAFERLREKAEAQVSTHEGDRRPSWAPPLILGEELAALCRQLGWLATDEKPIGRLWAEFATPKRSGQVLREKHISSLPLQGIICRGFQLFAGGERGNTSAMLFEAQRTQDGSWRYGPSFRLNDFARPYDRQREWESLIRQRTNLEHDIEHYKFTAEGEQQNSARQAAIVTRIEAIDALDATDAKVHDIRQERTQRVLKLARERILDFIGTPDAQMQTASRLWGHCCRCGKALTDPISLERGIGPDCYDRIRAFISANLGKRIEVISFFSGMPQDFVQAVWDEMKPLQRSFDLTAA